MALPDKFQGIGSSVDPFRNQVRTVRDDHPALARTLEHELEQIKQDYVQQLAKGVKTWDEYLRKVGVIEGLDIAIHRTKQVNDKLNA